MDRGGLKSVKKGLNKKKRGTFSFREISPGAFNPIMSLEKGSTLFTP